MIEKLKLGNEYTIIEVEDKINEIIDFINSEDDRCAMEITNKYEENEPIYISDQMIKDIIWFYETGCSTMGQVKEHLKQKGYKVEE